MKKLTCMLLALVMMLGAMALAEGADVIEISTAEQLAAIPKAQRICSSLRPSNRPAATAVPNTERVAVVCQFLRVWPRVRSRHTALVTSIPTTTASKTSAMVAPVSSATAKAALIMGLFKCKPSVSCTSS